MFEKLNQEEQSKVIDFMESYKKYLNPECNNEIDTVINYIFDIIIKVYLEYRNTIPYVSVEDDGYAYYTIRPVDGRYSLLDYLINTAMQNLDSIEFIDTQMPSNYNLLKKKMSLHAELMSSLPDTVFNYTKKPLDKDKYRELFYKHMIYHEIGHMLHYKIKDIVPNTVYVPSEYMSLSSFPPLKKRMSENAKKAELERRKEIVKKSAREKINRRISMYYECLGNKYDVLKPSDIDNCDLAVEKYFLFLSPIEEAFTECDAQVYSGMFENEIFEMDSENTCNSFYIPIGSEHIIMTYCPDAYFVSSNIGFALKECISKQSYFKTVFLGKEDLFIDFFGQYNGLIGLDMSFKLARADGGNIEDIQSLLDSIIAYAKENNKPLDWVNIYFPLVNKNGRWLYYTDAMNMDSPKTKKLVKPQDKE